jgi:phage terminase large subunit-like protein
VESGAWQVNVFPVCETFPCTREEFRGSWPDRFTYDFVKTQYDLAVKTGKVDTFNQELMLRIMSEEDRLIQDGDIGWYKIDAILRNKSRFNYYITTDFATSEKQKADFSVISVWAYNNNGDWLWVDGVVARQLMDKSIDSLFTLAQKWKPQQVGVEINGQQKGFIAWILEKQLERNIYFPLARERGSQEMGLRRPSTVSKFSDFQTVVPLFKTRKIFFPVEYKTDPRIVEFINELSLASVGGFKSKQDDCIDTVTQLSKLQPWKPSEEAPMQPSAGNEGMWDIDIEEVNTDRLASYIA